MYYDAASVALVDGSRDLPEQALGLGLADSPPLFHVRVQVAKVATKERVDVVAVVVVHKMLVAIDVLLAVVHEPVGAQLVHVVALVESLRFNGKYIIIIIHQMRSNSTSALNIYLPKEQLVGFYVQRRLKRVLGSIRRTRRRLGQNVVAKFSHRKRGLPVSREPASC